LDISGAVEDGQLRLDWEYSTEAHDEATVRRLADRMVAALEEIVEHCAELMAGDCTVPDWPARPAASDFPLARLTQPQVDRIAGCAGDGRAIEDVYPLTPLQAGMLFHSLVDAGSSAYLNQFRLRLGGVRDAAALGLAWQQVVDRTPILRTSVVWEGVDEPVQIVHRDVEVPISYRRIDGTVVAEDLAAGLDLTAAPLLRLIID